MSPDNSNGGCASSAHISAGAHRIAIGRAGEDLAVQTVENAGLRIVDRNWRDGPRGEIDIIACDDSRNLMVFIEVKTRTGNLYGSACESVTASKLHQLRRLAGAWLARNVGGRTIRIDIIAVTVPYEENRRWRAGESLRTIGADVDWIEDVSL